MQAGQAAAQKSDTAGVKGACNGCHKATVPNGTTNYKDTYKANPDPGVEAWAASQLKPGDFDWEKIFGQIGVRWFHTGGIFAALSENAAALTIPYERMKASHFLHDQERDHDLADQIRELGNVKFLSAPFWAANAWL